VKKTWDFQKPAQGYQKIIIFFTVFLEMKQPKKGQFFGNKWNWKKTKF